MKPGVEFTATLAAYHHIDPQGPDESETAFRERVSGTLRDQGHVIEAHEAYHNQRYDEGGDDGVGGPMVGAFGAAALALAGRDFGSTGVRLIGDEMMAGVIVKEPRPRDDGAALLVLAMAMMGSGDRR